MTLVTVRAIIGLLEQYGPILVRFGYDLKALYDFIEQHRGDHPSLTDGERARLESILSADRTTIGLGGSTSIGDTPAPVATNDKGYVLADFNRPLDAYPDVTKLDEGDVVWQQEDGKFYVAMHGFGILGVPSAGWRQIWPKVD